jgi:DNA invertase Pin-like site-specific DNA recombinase
MITVAYIRVSSRAQDHATQRSAIERFASARGDKIGAWYEEKKSAKTMGRAELTRLRADVRSGIVGKLYVFKLDRLVRTGVADTFAVVEEVRRAGAVLVAVADNLTIVPNKEDVASEVLVFALGLAAKLERTAINDRISAARERVEAEGGRWGRPSRLGGDDVARVVAMRGEGRSVRAIAMAMHVPRSTIARALVRAASRKPTRAEGGDRTEDSGSEQGVVR